MARSPLWSSELFGMASSAPRTADPSADRAFLRFGIPVARALALQPDRSARLSDLRDIVSRQVPDFDFDEFRAALDGLERRRYLTVTRDPQRGDHTYQLTKEGWALAA